MAARRRRRVRRRRVARRRVVRRRRLRIARGTKRGRILRRTRAARQRRRQPAWRRRHLASARAIRRARRRGGRARFWIAGAIKRPGRLRAYVRRVYGAAGFDAQGRIKPSILRRIAARGGRGGIGAAARLAIRLRGFRRRRR